VARRPTPTLRDVADAAGVHASTASRALDAAQSGRLSAATVERVERAASRLGYTPDPLAVGLKRGRSGTVGVVVADFENPFTAQLTRGLASALAERAHVALVAETEEDGNRLVQAVETFAGRRVDAIVVTAAHAGDGDALARIVARGVPVVLGIRGVRGGGFPMVLHDDLAGGSLAARHLLELGHRSFAQLPGPADIDTFVRRRRGFDDPLRAAGIEARTAGDVATAASIGEGRRLMRAVLETGPPPTAVFAPSDVMAVGALEVLAAAGLACPADVSVVGYNDVPLAAHLSPPLTTIRLHSEELGRAAARLAIAAIGGSPGEERAPVVTIPATLVVRGSTATPG
jgi:LacI family transcriptional regulator